MDIHEALLPKSAVQGNQEWTWLINHPCNVVLRHNNLRTCWHNPGVGGDVIFEKCARQIVSFEGHDSVEAYLVSMCNYYPTARTALRRFLAIKF